jgi:hypothetical protein
MASPEWAMSDLDQYGTYTDPHYAHSMAYFIRDLSKTWCESAALHKRYLCADMFYHRWAR